MKRISFKAFSGTAPYNTIGSRLWKKLLKPLSLSCQCHEDGEGISPLDIITTLNRKVRRGKGKREKYEVGDFVELTTSSGI